MYLVKIRYINRPKLDFKQATDGVSINGQTRSDIWRLLQFPVIN